MSRKRSLVEWLVVIAEIGGGAAGILVTGALLLGSLLTDGGSVSPMLAAAFSGYVLVLVAGVLLLRGSRFGRGLSIAAQAIQLPILSTGPLAYRLTAGLDVGWVLAASGSDLSLYPGANFLLSTSNTRPLSIGVNLVAALLLIALCRRPQPSAGRASRPVVVAGVVG